MVQLYGLGKAKTAFRAKYFFLVMVSSHYVALLLSPLTEFNRAKYNVMAGASVVMSAADGLLSEPIRFVDLLQPEYLNLKYSVLLQFESCLVMDTYY